MSRFVDGVVRIAFCAVDVSDGVARRAGDAGLGSGVVDVVEPGVVKAPLKTARHHDNRRTSERL